MPTWQRIVLVGPDGVVRAPGHVVEELKAGEGGAVLVGHPFGRIASYARLLSQHLARAGRAWAAEAELAVADDPQLLRLARRSGCRALVVGPDPDPLNRAVAEPDERRALRKSAAALRRIRRAGLTTVVHCALGRPGDDAGVFGRAVALCRAGRVTFPRLVAAEERGTMSDAELRQGLAWAAHALHGHVAIWRRTFGWRHASRAGLLANYRLRRAVLASPSAPATAAMRLARAVARPIRVRERVPFVSTLATAVQAGSGQVRSAWLRVRAMHDETRAALVIRLEGAIDARAARKLVARVERALRRTPERLVVDLGGLELVSLTVLTRFLEEHASRLAELRGRLAFRNLRPALAAVQENLHGMVPSAALLMRALEEPA
jgi:anti-anti-sigma regulatory factor